MKEDEHDEFAPGEDGSQGQKKKPPSNDKGESKNCCVICCRAVFCCKTRNTVDKEVEMRELRSSKSGE